MGQISNYLNDLYACQGYIAAVPRLHGELRFTFKPTRSMERQGFMKGLDRFKDDAVGAEKHYADFVAKKLTGWELTDEAGAQVPTTIENITTRLHWKQADKLYGIVTGTIPSDEDPLDAAAAGAPESESEAKNS